MNGLTTPSPIHLSRTWLSSSAVHGITGGSSNTFPSGLFLFSPTDAVIAWDAGSLFVLMVCQEVLEGMGDPKRIAWGSLRVFPFLAPRGH